MSRNEHARLMRKWATGKATRAEILRCMELDRIRNNPATPRENQAKSDEIADSEVQQK